MKTLRFLPLLAVLAACNANWSGTDCVTASTEPIERELTVQPFNGVVSAGSIDVVLTRGDVQHVVASGPAELLDIISTEVKSGVWQIRTTKCYSTTRPVSIAITIPKLTSAEVEGSANITGATPFSPESIDIGIEGSGNIELQVECKDAQVEIAGSGSVTLTGTCGTLKASIAGSGDIKGVDLSCATAKVAISGSGDVELTVIQELSADINGSGDVRYRGRPTVSSDINGSGSVAPME